MINSRRILLTESEWASSPLTIARWLGAARLNGHVYKLDRRYMVLVRDDYSRFLRPLGLDVMMKADKRYGTGRKSLKIIQRLYYIITKQKQCI